MEIQSIQIEYAQKNGFSSNTVDGICHCKTLPYLSVVQAVEGQYEIGLGGADMQKTGTGGFFTAPAHIQQTIIHHADPISKNMTCRWVFLKIKINGFYDFDDLFQLPLLVPETQKGELHAVFDRLFCTDNAFDEHVCYYRIIKILSQLMKKKTEKIPVQLSDVLAYMHRHYKEKITIEDLSNTARLSSSHFFSVFKRILGISPMAYLNNYRLSLAAELLLHTDRTVTEIADDVGVNDSVYLNKMFRKAYQMSPSQYRNTYK